MGPGSTEGQLRPTTDHAQGMKFSEGMGFEPMGAKSSAELAIRFFRPLRHPSTIKEQKVFSPSTVVIHEGKLIFLRKIIAILKFMSIFKRGNLLFRAFS